MRGTESETGSLFGYWDRLLDGEGAHIFPKAIVEQPQVKRLLLSVHFLVEGTPIEAWASFKSFLPKDGSGEPSAPGCGQRAA